jgi:hypothetical protein
MRSAIGFLSLLAFGFLAAGVMMVVNSGGGPALSLDGLMAGREAISADGGIHLGSLMIGLVLGLFLSALARVSWSELPRRFAEWLMRYERSFYRLALAGVLVGLLVFY